MQEDGLFGHMSTYSVDMCVIVPITPWCRAIIPAAATGCYVDLELASGEYRYTPL